VLGSKVKIENLRNEWKSIGLDEKALQHIHAPIGINIRSQTPEEIAVSIVAQIIDIKNAG
jgi:xanthine dehydrogenase accessory factor